MMPLVPLPFLIYFRQGGYVIPGSCLFIYLSVGMVTDMVGWYVVSAGLQ